MKIHPQVTHLNGLVSVVLTAQFVGDNTDTGDRDRISSYGDPLINMGGQFSDGATPTPYTFATGAPEVFIGLTTRMNLETVRFMRQLPSGQSTQGPLDVVTSDPATAASIYVTTIQSRIALAMTQLRLATPAKLTTLPDSTV